MTPEIRHATAADYEALFGEKPPRSLRGLAVTLDGRPVGIGALVYRDDDLPVIVSKVADELRPYRKTIAETGRRLMAMVDGVPAIAVADPAEKTAPRFLAWLGMRFLSASPDGDVFVRGS